MIIETTNLIPWRGVKGSPWGRGHSAATPATPAAYGASHMRNSRQRSQSAVLG